MCEICEKVKKLTGKDVTEEEAHALIQEKSDAMDAMRPELIKDTVAFVNATREKFGEGTFPPLMSAMALIIGSTIGKIPDDHIRSEALMNVFGEINAGVNLAMGSDQKDVPDDEKKQAAFNVNIVIGPVNEIKEHIAETMRADVERARTAQEINFTVKPPILH